MVGWKESAVLMQIMNAGLEGYRRRPHPHIDRETISFPQVAWRTGSYDIFPGRQPALGTRDDMIECQVVASPAILASESITQKHIEPRESGPARRLNIGFERYDGGQAHFECRAANSPVVLGDNIHALKANGFDCILPRPQRQRVIAQGSKISVQDERWAALRRDLGLEVDRQRAPLGYRPGIQPAFTLIQARWRFCEALK